MAILASYHHMATLGASPCGGLERLDSGWKEVPTIQTGRIWDFGRTKPTLKAGKPFRFGFLLENEVDEILHRHPIG